jgi:AraC-like DNA-binding protein
MMSDRIFNFHDVCIFIVVVECLLLAAYRLALPSVRKVDSRLFAAFLLAVAVDSASLLVMWNPYFPVSPFFKEHLLPYFFITSQLVRGPLFFFYVKALTHARFRWDRRQLVHGLPALGGIIVLAVGSVETSDLQRLTLDTQKTTVGILLWHFVTLISIGYAIAALIILNRYYHRLKDSYSDIPVAEIGWLSALTASFLISWTWSLIIILVADIVGGAMANTLGTADNYIRLLLMNALFVYSLHCTHRMLGDAESTEKVSGDHAGGEVLAKIQNGIDVHRLHLQPNINIEEFSSRINLPVKTVSYAINNELGTRFFEFINYHRIQEAKALLADEDKADLTVLDILMMSGFNNKSSFHRFFKRMVKMSPTEYRRAAQNPVPPADVQADI